MVIEELGRAPQQVQNILRLLPEGLLESVTFDEEATALRNAYVAAGILNRKSLNDAAHVALATIHRADAIVSWNFKHIVRLDNMRAFNQINLANGYGVITIISPREVLLEKEDN